MMNEPTQPLYVKLEEYAHKMSSAHRAVTESMAEHSAAASATRDTAAIARYNKVKELEAAKGYARSGGT